MPASDPVNAPPIIFGNYIDMTISSTALYDLFAARGYYETIAVYVVDPAD